MLFLLPPSCCFNVRKFPSFNECEFDFNNSPVEQVEVQSCHYRRLLALKELRNSAPERRESE